ncbi:MAG TPA: GGDEF domain-containing protein [Actinomycetota bacterium]|nr:GGDEF domain-containing protein [Actinomycetota bacterium]
MADRTQPLLRDALFRNVGPLVGATFSALLALAIAQATGDGGRLLIQAATLTCLTVSALLLVPWDRLPPYAQVAPAVSYAAVAFLIREATGGHDSIYAQLVLVPILWLAVYGTIVEVAAGVASVGLILISPLLLVPDAAPEWPRTLLLLVVTCLVGFGVQRLFDYLRRHADQLARLARTDPLTGVSNRRAWEEDLEMAIARAQDGRTPICVALIDLDRFKEYNDGNGHQAGDRLLKEVTARWRAVLRDGDVLARLGGDEFAVILPGCPLDAAQRIVERLREGVPSGQTCSTGLASWNGLESAPQLIARCDAALYQAKEAGRNRIVVAA